MLSMFYHSLRIGKGGQPFYLLKFRTFKKGLDGGLPTASINDPRLSKWGKWLRRFKLDELATIWNLIKGDITIVGPRPDTPDEIATLDENTRKLVYSIKPGIISPATLHNYKEDEILSAQENPHEYYTKVIKPVKYYLNCWYVRNKSWKLDFRIILSYMLKLMKLPYLWLNIYPPNFYGRS
mgnify:CR=1 FL=1